MDNTVLEHFGDVDEMQSEFHARFAEHLDGVDVDVFFNVFWQKGNDLFDMVKAGVIDGESVRVWAFRGTLKAFYLDRELAPAMRCSFEDILLENSRLYDDTLPTLEEFRRRGYRLALVTNGLHCWQWRKIAHHELEGWFDVVLVGEDTGHFKPHPHMFLEALERFGLSPREALVVGDMPDRDIEGALAAGIRPVLITHESRFPYVVDTSGLGEEALSNLIRIKSLAELIPVVEELNGQG